MKGQAKALELVIALFVLLVVAVALIQFVLPAFSQGEESFSGPLEDLSRQQAIDKAEEKCNLLCDDIRDSDGSQGSVVAFCSGVASENGLDIDAKGKKGYSEIGGIGVCKERIPCFRMVECRYPSGAQPYDANSCKSAICSYYSGLGLSEERVNEELNKRLSPGDCYNASFDLHWFAVSFDNAEAGALECPE